jgi:hypothetical protein
MTGVLGESSYNTHTNVNTRHTEQNMQHHKARLRCRRAKISTAKISTFFRPAAVFALLLVVLPSPVFSCFSSSAGQLRLLRAVYGDLRVLRLAATSLQGLLKRYKSGSRLAVRTCIRHSVSALHWPTFQRQNARRVLLYPLQEHMLICTYTCKGYTC